MERYFFTSESVTEGHPDKVADAISDSVLDSIMGQDKNCRVACETLVTTGLAFISGEITTDYSIEIQSGPGSSYKRAQARIGAATNHLVVNSKRGAVRLGRIFDMHSAPPPAETNSSAEGRQPGAGSSAPQPTN